MKFGVLTLPSDLTLDLGELGPAVERRGFDSLFVPEHTHIPVGSTTPHPGGITVLPEAMQGFDPFVALSVLAAKTSTLKLGTGICEVPIRDPLILAKQVASLDVVSGGRFLFGVGSGWLTEEMLNHGVEPSTRHARLDEYLAAMKTVWAKHEAAFAGRFVKFDPVISLPKPLQRPYPPVLMGVGGPRAIDRVLAADAEWMPWARLEGDGLADRIAELNGKARELGREPVPVTLVEAEPDEEAIAHYAEIGVTRCVFALPSTADEDVLMLLDWYAELVLQFR
ncbi:LLM class F420-dependent oxidoreductase [Actinokineospora xionganensis]|uniref:LLM class F420-dependent oxidoreductase n=1 Tax=Actinokineospora xionganensis TaxID=2684470 RepID=A0ABR7KZV7_9PSEU|nr:LLM class F420-dependent oxidoreductase [Actinokineospora xionganensis]MBC6445966.1 LLM class F420-dependent oxidoreductase [Actinokineospora xionganensis]